MSFNEIPILVFFRKIDTSVLIFFSYFFFLFLEFSYPAIKRPINQKKRILPNFLPLLIMHFWVPILGVLLYKVSIYARTNGYGLLNAFEIENFWIHLGLVFLVRNFAGYIHHRLHHKIPFLWRFHAVHHADRTMDVTNTWRFHMLEISINTLLQAPYIFIFGLSVEVYIIYEVIFHVWNLWSHSNISIPRKFRRIIETVFYTPDGHRIHHAVDSNIHDHNFGSIINIWDRIFGTYKPGTDEVDDFDAGIKGAVESDYHKLWNVLVWGYPKKSLKNDQD